MATTRFADHLLTGTHASLPAASAVPAGTLYSCTTHSLIYQSDGASTWSTYASLVGNVAADPIIDAKGDLIVGTAADTAARLAVGSNNQVLVADSAQTAGVKWAAVPGGGYVAVDTIWDAKGDLAVASAADTAARLPVGSNNQVLTADSAQTLGVKWATPASGTTIASDTIWDAKGDIVAASAADTGGRLAVGTDGHVLTADSAQTLGVKWAAAGGSSGALTLLSTTTLSGDGTFDVSSISGSYNDLILIVIVRGTRAAGTELLQLRLNNDSGTNYEYQQSDFGSSSSIARGTNQTSALVSGAMSGDTATANFFSVFEIVIPGYASSTWFKTGYVVAGSPASAVNNQYSELLSFLWRSTSAVNRVGLYGGITTNLKSGSQLRIYGRT